VSATGVVAVKKSKRETDTQKEAYIKERMILSLAIGQERIVQLLGFPEVDADSKTPGYLIMEAADFCGFTKFMKYPDDPRPTEKMGFVHGDVKPDNFLFFQKQRRWKLCDFGLSFPATHLGSGGVSQAYGYTDSFCPPEAEAPSAGRPCLRRGYVALI
jgi:hypothetical protein